MVYRIYAGELQLNKANSFNTEASFFIRIDPFITIETI